MTIADILAPVARAAMRSTSVAAAGLSRPTWRKSTASHGPVDAPTRCAGGSGRGATANESRSAFKVIATSTTGRLTRMPASAWRSASAPPPSQEPPSIAKSFLTKLRAVAAMVDTLECAGFELREVESLREHYARTPRAWLASLEANRDNVIDASTPGRARVWRLYMAAFALAFDANLVCVNQILAVKSTARAVSGTPPTRKSSIPPIDPATRMAPLFAHVRRRHDHHARTP